MTQLIMSLILGAGYAMLMAGFLLYLKLKKEVTDQEKSVYEEFLQEMEHVGEGKDKHFISKIK
jgi:hypothetical protein